MLVLKNEGDDTIYYRLGGTATALNGTPLKSGDSEPVEPTGEVLCIVGSSSASQFSLVFIEDDGSDTFRKIIALSYGKKRGGGTSPMVDMVRRITSLGGITVDSTWYAYTFDSSITNETGGFPVPGNLFTATRAGVYAIVIAALFTGVINGERAIRIKVAGVVKAQVDPHASSISASHTQAILVAHLRLAVGDQITVEVMKITGSAADTPINPGGAFDESCYASIVFLG
jgi:hypothetical protein